MSNARYKPGDAVKVRASFPPGHVRTPYFVRGCDGVITQYVGSFPNPEELAYGRDGKPEKPLYRVQFNQSDVWPNYDGPKHDTMVIDIYEHWLEQI